MLIEIKKISGEIIFSHDCENNSLKVAVEAAVKGKVDLRGADLGGADLRWADLRGADLYRADLDGEKINKNPLVITGLTYWILITEKYMRIGCERYSHEEWGRFSDDEIEDMDSDAALEFWNGNKSMLLTICKNHANLT